MPVQRVRQDAAEEHADRPAAGGDEPEDAHRLRALGGLREEGHDQRERDRRDHRAAQPLDRPRSDEEGLCRRQAAGERGEREERDSDQEQAPLAEEIPEPAAQQQEATEGQQVGVHDPRE